jgi:hypothetical protein
MHDTLVFDLTKKTICLAFVVAIRDSAKVCVVAVALHRITGITERLKVRDVVSPAVVTRHDVIDFKGFVGVQNAA